MGLNEIIHEKCGAQGLAPSKHPINVPLREKQRGVGGAGLTERSVRRTEQNYKGKKP